MECEINPEGAPADEDAVRSFRSLDLEVQRVKLKPEEIWASRRFQDWKRGFDKIAGIQVDGETGGINPFALCLLEPETETKTKTPDILELKCERVKLEVQVSKLEESATVEQDEKLTPDLQLATPSDIKATPSGWKQALAEVTLSPPTTPAELTQYLIGYSKLTVMALGEMVLSNSIDFVEMETYVKSDLRQLLMVKVEEYSKKDISTDRTLQVFDLWFDKFVVDGLVDERRKIGRVFKTVDIIFGAKFKKVTEALCAEWALKLKSVEDVLSSLFDIEDEESELEVIKAIGGSALYRQRKVDQASAILKCLERIAKFDLEMERSLNAAGCFPEDLELKKLADGVKGELRPFLPVDGGVSMSLIALEGRMNTVLEEVRGKWAETNKKGVEFEEALVDQALKYVKSRHVAMLEIRQVKECRFNMALGDHEGYHLNQVEILTRAFGQVPGFTYNSLWDPERVKGELTQAFDQWVLKLVVMRAEQVLSSKPILPVEVEASLDLDLDQISEVSSTDTFLMDQVLVQQYTPSGVGIFISGTGIHDDSESWKLSMSIRNPGAPELKSSFDVTTLLTSATPFADQLIQFKPKSPHQQVYNEEILALQFRRMAKTLISKFKKPAQETLVLALPSETPSTSRVRLKTAVTLAGFASSLFIQATTAIACGYTSEPLRSVPSLLIAVYIQNSLIDVTVFEVSSAGKCTSLATGSSNNNDFEINVRTIPSVAEHALSTIGSTLAAAEVTIAEIQNCVVLVDKSLVKHGDLWTFGNCATRIHSRIKCSLTKANPQIQVDLRGRKVVHQGIELISKEAREYNQSDIYREKCPWEVYLDFGDGNAETLLEANGQVNDAVVKRVKCRQIVGDLLGVRRRRRGKGAFGGQLQVGVEGIEECKQVFADSGAYIDVECDPQGLVDLRPCELWEETFARQRACMPVKPAVVKSAKERIEAMCRMTMPREGEKRQADQGTEGARVAKRRRST